MATLEKMGSVVTRVRMLPTGELELFVGTSNDDQDPSEFDRLDAAGLL
jgi:hypothetical protein